MGGRGAATMKVFFKILQNSQKNTRARISFLLQLQTKSLTLWHRCFPLDFSKFLTPFLLNNSVGYFCNVEFFEKIVNDFVTIFHYTESLFTPFWKEPPLMDTAFRSGPAWNDSCYH